MTLAPLTAPEIWQCVQSARAAAPEEIIADTAALIGATGLLLQLLSGEAVARGRLTGDEALGVHAVCALLSQRYLTMEKFGVAREQSQLEERATIALLALAAPRLLASGVPRGLQSRVTQYQEKHEWPSQVIYALLRHASVLTSAQQVTGHEITASDRVLDTVIAVRERLVEVVPPGHPERIACLSDLGGMLQHRYARTGSAADLTQAVAMARSAVALVSADDRNYQAVHTTAGGTLNLSFGLTGEPRDLEEGIAALRKAVQASTRSGRPPGPALSNLGNALRSRYELFGVPQDLLEAAEASRSALAGLPAGHPQRGIIQYSLAGTLATLYGLNDALTDLDEAIGLFRGLLSHPVVSGRDRANYLTGLGQALATKSKRTGDLADLNAAEECLTSAMAVVTTKNPEYQRTAAALAGVVGTRAERSGDVAAMDRAIRFARDAMEAVPRGSPDYADSLSLLARLLESRSRRTLVASDAEAAVAAAEAVVAQTPATSPSLPDRRASLGLTYLQLSRLQPTKPGRRLALDSGIGQLQKAIKGFRLPGQERGMALSNLAGALEARFELTGDPADLDEATRHMREAVAAVPEGQPHHAWLLANLGGALGRKAAFTKSPADYAAAEQVLEEALQIAESDDLRRHDTELNLANILSGSFELDHDRARGLRALDLFNRVTGTPAMQAGTRVTAARQAAGLAAELGDWDTALGLYRTAIDLLPLVVWHGLRREDRLFALRAVGGLAGDAAAAALMTNQPELAVVLLEQGRGILAGQALDLAADGAAVRQHYPDLADRMDAVRARLDQAGQPAPAPVVGQEAAWSAALARSDQSGERQALAREWDELVAQARNLPGLSDFLRPPTFERLRHAADAGPVVIVNLGRHRCDLLILTVDGVTAVPLPGVDRASVTGRAGQLQDAFNKTSWSAARRIAADMTLREVLAWLWDEIVAPAVNELGLSPVTAGADPPRLWWCATSVTSFLPLHAAGHYAPDPAQNTGPSLPQYAASSYMPTLRALLEARERALESADDGTGLAAGIPDSSVLAFALAEAQGQDPLDQVNTEIAALRARFPGMTLREGPAATRAEFLAQLPRYAVLHFAGHGLQNLFEPAQAVLGTYDEPVTLDDLLAADVPGARLAFLSACQTAVGAVHVLDESVHIAAALQLAGFPQAIATQWSVADRIAPRVAKDFYALLDIGDRQGHAALDTNRAALALNRVVRRLSSELPPLFWAPFIHTGT